MRKMKQKIAIITLCLFIITIGSTNVFADEIGVGVSPTSFTISNALRGGEFEKEITIINPTEEESSYTFNATGIIKDWVSFHNIDDLSSIDYITVPGKESDETNKKKVIVRIKVPADVSNDIYNGTIYIKTAPKETTGDGGLSTKTRVPIRVGVDVSGTQILNGTVNDIYTRDIEINYPLRINVLFENTGNVIATPSIDVKILKKDGKNIDSFVHDNTSVKPYSTDTIELFWNSTGYGVGEYDAMVSVYLGGKQIGEKKLSFNILERGSLTRTGDIKELYIENEPVVGIYIKIHATFENTGEIESDVQFKGEVYKNDNLIDIVTSDEILLLPGETETLTSYYKINEPGIYKIRGIILFSGKQTDPQEFTFLVEGSSSGDEISGTTIFGNRPEIPLSMLFIVLIVIIMIIMIFKKGKKEKNN